MGCCSGPFVLDEAAFVNPTASLTGKYSELLALSAMVARGRQVALPFGNQHGWDFLVELDGKWQRVQVKTVRTAFQVRGYAVGLYRGAQSKGLKRKAYSKEDTDFIAAVLPATGTIWMVPIELAADKTHLTLTNEHLWVVGGLHSVDNIAPPLPLKRQTSKIRMRLALNTIQDWSKPSEVSDVSWDMLIKYRDGHGYRSLASQYGIREDTIRERVGRVARKVFRREHCPNPISER